MDKYFNRYREMISLCGLSDHTLKYYCTYIRSYLDYLHSILHKPRDDTDLTYLGAGTELPSPYLLYCFQRRTDKNKRP